MDSHGRHCVRWARMHDLPFDDIRHKSMESWVGDRHHESPFYGLVPILRLVLVGKWSFSRIHIMFIWIYVITLKRRRRNTFLLPRRWATMPLLTKNCKKYSNVRKQSRQLFSVVANYSVVDQKLQHLLNLQMMQRCTQLQIRAIEQTLDYICTTTILVF